MMIIQFVSIANAVMNPVMNKNYLIIYDLFKR